MDADELDGKWVSEYDYGTNSSDKHAISFKHEGNFLVGLGTNETESSLTLRLEFDPKNNVLSGTWHEFTSPKGKYKGAEFHGAVQFILNKNMNKAVGKWVGFNDSKEVINSGSWTLTRVQK